MPEATEKLRLEGIYRKGYGIVPKFVMHDLDLSLESKAIYAYLCALAGNGDETFPYRDTILRQLGMAKNTYYVHYKPLIEQGYIRVDRPADKNAANIYTLVSNPKKLAEADDKSHSYIGDSGRGHKENDSQNTVGASVSGFKPGGHEESDLQNTVGASVSGFKPDGRLRYRGLKVHGYGSLPRAVMQDEKLSVKAKGLYAYFCSYCGAGDTAFPRKDNILYHLGISEPTYYKALGQLKELDYLRIEQRKEAGRFAVNDYWLNEFPGCDESPYQNNCDMEKPYIRICDTVSGTDNTVFDDNGDTSSSPCLKNCDTKKRDMINRDAKNGDPYLINKSNINEFNNKSPSGEEKKKNVNEGETRGAEVHRLERAKESTNERTSYRGGSGSSKAAAGRKKRSSSYDLDELERMIADGL